MKKIVVTTHDPLNPLVGGGAIRTLKVAREICNRGNKVRLIVPSISSTIENMPVFPLPAPRKVRSQVLSAIKFNFRLLWRLFKYAGGADLIFVHNTIAMPAVLFFSWLIGKEIILDITDIHAEYLYVGRINVIEKFIRPFLLWFEYFMIRQAKKVIVVTEAMKERIVRKGCPAKKVSVIYDGVDIKRFSSEKEPDAINNIIHIGLIDKQHGVHYIALAAEKIIKIFPNVHFYIIGDGRELPRVKKIVKEKNLNDYFTFIGFVSHYEIQKYLRKCYIGVIPRPDSLANNLVMTLKLPEYWASGTAVVASRLRGMEEVAENDKDIIFFTPDNYDDLADKIIYLLSDEARIKKIAYAGQQTVSKFSWTLLIKNIVDIILNN